MKTSDLWFTSFSHFEDHVQLTVLYTIKEQSFSFLEFFSHFSPSTYSLEPISLSFIRAPYSTITLVKTFVEQRFSKCDLGTPWSTAGPLGFQCPNSLHNNTKMLLALFTLFL